MSKINLEEVKKKKEFERNENLEKLLSMAGDMAKIRKANFDALIGEGFTPAQALQLIK